MVGNNELKLCEAEVLVALQEYLDKRTVKPEARVSHIKFYDGYFIMSLEEVIVGGPQ